MNLRTRGRHIATGLAVAAAISVGALFVGSGAGASPKPGPAHLDHVFVIMLENHSQSSVIGDANAPFLNSLAHQYAVATRYYGVTHPSLPNYVAAISGSNWAVNDDQPTNRFNHWNLVDQLEFHHLTWTAYMESLPSAGALDNQYPANAQLYTTKHNPFILFDDIRSSDARRALIKPYSDFAGDMGKDSIPNFVWISPNQCHDMHGGVFAPVAADGSDGTPCPFGSAKDDANDASLKKKADDFVSGAVKTIIQSSAWKAGHAAIFIVTDENDFTGNRLTDGWEDASGCCDTPVLPNGYQFLASSGKPDGNVWGGGYYGGGLIPAIIVTTNGKKGGFTSDEPVNHYSLLRTIEANWHLGYLGAASDHIQVDSLAQFLTP